MENRSLILAAVAFASLAGGFVLAALVFRAPSSNRNDLDPERDAKAPLNEPRERPALPDTSARIEPAPPATKIGSSDAGSTPDPLPLSFKTAIPSFSSTAPAIRYANLSGQACLTESRRRGLPVQLLTRPARGVRTPMRLAGPIHGVTFHVPGPRTVYSVLDCRLALALADVARLVGELGIVRVTVDNMYRPGARVRGTDKPSQHAEGLALDILAFERKGEPDLDVETDWHGPIGTPPCGATAGLNPSTDRAIALRNAICAIARARLFHHVITPSRDVRHRDHVHLDLEAGVESGLLE